MPPHPHRCRHRCMKAREGSEERSTLQQLSLELGHFIGIRAPWVREQPTIPLQVLYPLGFPGVWHEFQ